MIPAVTHRHFTFPWT